MFFERADKSLSARYLFSKHHNKIRSGIYHTKTLLLALLRKSLLLACLPRKIVLEFLLFSFSPSFSEISLLLACLLIFWRGRANPYSEVFPHPYLRGISVMLEDFHSKFMGSCSALPRPLEIRLSLAKTGAVDVLGWLGWAQSSQKWAADVLGWLDRASTQPKGPRMCWDGRVELKQAENGAADVLEWLAQAQPSQKWGRGCGGMAGSSSNKPKMGSQPYKNTYEP